MSPKEYRPVKSEEDRYLTTTRPSSTSRTSDGTKFDAYVYYVA